MIKHYTKNGKKLHFNDSQFRTLGKALVYDEKHNHVETIYPNGKTFEFNLSQNPTGRPGSGAWGGCDGQRLGEWSIGTKSKNNTGLLDGFILIGKGYWKICNFLAKPIADAINNLADSAEENKRQKLEEQKQKQDTVNNTKNLTKNCKKHVDKKSKINSKNVYHPNKVKTSPDNKNERTR